MSTIRHIITRARQDLIAAVENRVCNALNIPPEQIRLRGRHNLSTKARFACWYILRKKYNIQYTLIAQVYEKHHTTVMYGVEYVEREKLLEQLGINL